MNGDEKSSSLNINKNSKKYMYKSKLKLPSTNDFQIIKSKNINTKILNNKVNNKKNVFYKIIINNIKKYNFNQHQYNIRIINNLIIHKYSHYISKLKDMIIFFYLNENLKRYYTKNEIIKGFPKFYIYYKNYFKFFLKPILTDFYFCDIIRKNANKQASFFYDQYHDKFINKDKKNNKFESIFTKKQKLEIQNINCSKREKNKYNNIREKDNNISTIVFSYESFNNSKDKNIQNKDDSSISLESIANLISKISKNKNKESNGKDYIKNRINLFLNLEDKTLTQKSSTIFTSSRIKKNETLKEKLNDSNKKNFYGFLFNNYNESQKIKENKNITNNIVKNHKKNEFALSLNMKSLNINKNRNLYLPINSKFNTFNNNINQKIFKESSSANKGSGITIIPTKKNLKKSYFTSTNINTISNDNYKNILFTNNDSNNNIKSFFRETEASYPLKSNYYQSTQIINNNKSQKNFQLISRLKKPFSIKDIINQDLIVHRNGSEKHYNFKDYCISTTQIIKIKKKKSVSRNITTDLEKNKKWNLNGKNIFFSSEINNMNKKGLKNDNKKPNFGPKIFYKTFGQDIIKERNILKIVNENNIRNGNIINLRYFSKNKY